MIHGNVVGDSILEPIEVEQSGLIAHALVVIGLDLQKFGELHHPNFGEFLAIQQFVDEFGAFVRTRVHRKAVIVLFLRSHSNDVEKNSAKEYLVRAQTGLSDPQLVKFFMNEGIDVVVGR